MTAESESFDAELDGFPSDARPPTSGREPLELLATRFASESREGLNPSIEDYVRRFPELADEIRELFPMVAAMEIWKGHQQSDQLRQQFPDQSPLERVGDFQLVREIGRGGMGMVFEGRHIRHHRRVAIKLLPWKHTDADRWERRFRHEADTLVNLRHPNIVPIESFGEQQGYYYFVMQFIDGLGLDRLIMRLEEVDELKFAEEIPGDAGRSSGPWHESNSSIGEGLSRRGWSAFARLTLQVALALRAAHQQGVLHNDIKPANLLVDFRGKVWVTDFGVARPIEESLAGDQEGWTGTLRYMPPEKFQGQVVPASDVYSLGVTLFELITRSPAFPPGTPSELVDRITRSRQLDPGRVVRGVPRNLRMLVRNATAARLEDRYASAEALARDCLKCVQGRRVRARSRRWWRRRRSAE